MAQPNSTVGMEPALPTTPITNCPSLGQCWSSLPEGLLWAVLQQLPDFDLVDVAQVCKAWRPMALALARSLAPRSPLLRPSPPAVTRPPLSPSRAASSRDCSAAHPPAPTLWATGCAAASQQHPAPCGLPPPATDLGQAWPCPQLAAIRTGPNTPCAAPSAAPGTLQQGSRNSSSTCLTASTASGSGSGADASTPRTISNSVSGSSGPSEAGDTCSAADIADATTGAAEGKDPEPPAGPPLLAGFCSVTSLSLARCPGSTDEQLGGALALLPHLRHLALHPASDLTACCFEQMGRPCLPHLAVLDVGGCSRLRWPSLEHLARMPALTTLRLAGCSWLSAPMLARLPAVGPRLVELDLGAALDGAELSDEALRGALAGLAHLQVLRLDHCRRLHDSTCGAVAGALAPMGQLHTLGLAGSCWLTGEGVAALAPLAGCLTSLDLGACSRLDKAALANLSLLPGLCALSLGGCRQLAGSDLAAMAVGAQARGLAALDVRGLLLTAPYSVTHLCAFTGLRDITLEGMSSLGRQSGRVLGHLLHEMRAGGPLAGVTGLVFGDCCLLGGVEVAGQGLEALISQAGQLVRLGLPHVVGLTPSVVRAITALPNLRSLDLSLCGLSPFDGAVPPPGTACLRAAAPLAAAGAAAHAASWPLSMSGPAGLRELVLAFNCFPSGVLRAWLASMPLLERLTLNGHPMRCTLMAKDVSAALSGHRCLVSLELSGCPLVRTAQLPQRLARAASAAASAHDEAQQRSGPRRRLSSG